MWLLPYLPSVSRWIATSMHRITAVEGAVDPVGPVLLVANHPNALIDPVVVTAAVGRPVRWLAKSTLVFQPWIGWLFRAAGAIPVYRRQDDAAQMARNADTFDAAVQALADGSVVALFPEGISHDAPGLAPLKTGAARLALQAAQQIPPFPIIPVGVIYRDAATYRSPAGVVIGSPVAWEDLRAAGPDDREAVTDLTARLTSALGAVTRQLDSWADQEIVEHAAAVVAASTGQPEPPPSWVARASGIHGVLDATNNPLLPALRVRVQRHARALQRLGLTPAQLAAPAPSATRMWRGWRAPVVALVWLIGVAWTWLPYRATGWVVALLTRDRDLMATLKAVTGFLLFVGWILGTAIVIGCLTAWWWGVLTVPLAGGLAFLTLQLEEARLATADAERVALWYRRGSTVVALREEQRALGEELLRFVPAAPAPR